jgi:hypothetical protein
MLKEENKIQNKEKWNKHLSTVFVIVGIVSFTLGGIVNYYTIRRLNGK